MYMLPVGEPVFVHVIVKVVESQAVTAQEYAFPDPEESFTTKKYEYDTHGAVSDVKTDVTQLLVVQS